MTERVAWTREEAAAALGIGVRTLSDWTIAGFIPSIKRGGIRLYSVDRLRQWAVEVSEYDGGGEVSRGKAKALGNGVLLSAGWGQTVGRRGQRRQPAPRPIRRDAETGDGVAG